MGLVLHEYTVTFQVTVAARTPSQAIGTARFVVLTPEMEFPVVAITVVDQDQQEVSKPPQFLYPHVH